MIATCQLLISSCILLPIFLATADFSKFGAISSKAFYAIVALALLSTALAYVIYFFLLRRVQASQLMLVTFLIPISAITLGVLLLNERLTHLQMTGVVIILLALLILDGRLLAKLKTKNEQPS